MGSKEDEDFWYSSEKRSFSFENNDVDPLFRLSRNDSDKLWAGVAGGSKPEGECLRAVNEHRPLKPILSMISEKTLSCILMADKQQNCYSESLPTVLQPDITLKRIFLGQPYTLEQYRSLASKTSILDAAIISGDANAILIIMLFLTKSLKKSIVQRLLAGRQELLNIYIRYLTTRLHMTEISDILAMLGQSADAAIKSLQNIVKNARDPERLLIKLRNCHKTQFSTLIDCKEASFVQCYIKLLEWQTAVKAAETSEDLSLNSSVRECLWYTCKAHWNAASSSWLSPTNFIQEHDVSSKQFEKLALQVKASLAEWNEIDKLLLTKGWLGNKKLQTSLSIEEVLKILHQSNAPTEVLEAYLKFVDNIDDRLRLAKNLHCYRIAIDIFLQQGDRTALLEYKSLLQPQSEEYFYAESALRLPSVKWRNSSL